MQSFSRFVLCVACLWASFSRSASADDDRFAKWEKEIARFEEQDKQTPPAKGRTLFVGSSSIRLWDLKSTFPEQPVVNRGFGGSQIPDATHFVDRIVLPHEPRTIVFYSGDNDINAGRSAEQVAADFEQFTAKVWDKLPKTRIVFIAIKPSPARAKHFETQKAANERIRRFAVGHHRLSILDVVPAMLDESGQPREELYRKDKLHLNAAGYELWTRLLNQHLREFDSPGDDQSEPGAVALLKAKRVVFLGDSITYAGQYLTYLEFVLTTQFPHQQFDFIDLGLPSETCSGLSEPGHAGGKFPRPDVHERLQRVLDKLKPELLVACYGMNCGMYHPLSDDRFAAYQNGQRRLRDTAEAAGAKLIHLTPPVFDPIPLAGRTLPAGRDSYSQPYEGYNDVLDKFSEWLVAQREQGWTVIDLHRPMNEHLAKRRKSDPNFLLAGDGVHAGPTGHWLMAEAIIDTVHSVPTMATSLEVLDEPTEISWNTSIPLPMESGWDGESLKLTRTSAFRHSVSIKAEQARGTQYDIVEEGKIIGEVTAAQLKKGDFDIALLSKLSINVRAAELMKLIQKRQRLLTDSWLNEVGHLRPGMAKALPVADAQAQAAELSTQITKLAQPVEVKVRFVAK